MPVMPGNVSKGSILDRLDHYVNTSAANAQGLLAALKPDDENPNLTALGQGLGIVKGGASGPWKAEGQHLNQDWFSSSDSAWWRDHQPIEHVIAKGLQQAVRLCLYIEGDPNGTARTTPYLLDSYWICAGSHFEVTCGVKDHPNSNGQVTMMILTPSPVEGKRRGKHKGGLGDRGDFPRDENIWTTKRPDYGPGQQIISDDPQRRHAVVRMRTKDYTI